MYTNEEKAIQAVATITAIFSVIGSSVSLSTFYGQRSLSLKRKQLLVLSILDLLTAIFFSIGYAGTESEGFCQFQAFIISFGTLSSVLWNALMAFQLHLWIVKKKNEKRVKKKLKKNAQVSLCCSLILALILLASGLLGETSTWCWIEEGKDWAKFLFFYSAVLCAWAHNFWIILKTRDSCKDDSKNSTEYIIMIKMQEHLAIFVLSWFFGFLNFVVEAIAGEPVFGTGILQAFFVPLQGFMNAVMYGGILSEDSPLRVFASKSVRNSISNSSQTIPTVKSKRLSALKHVEYVPREISIFSTTFNLGEAPMGTVGDLSTWLRDGHDIYAIGLQECMCLDELRDAMHTHLGGTEKFVMYKAEIGSDNTRLGFHGFIALTVFVRKEDVDAGFILMTESAAGDVANGANLVVTTAANKGAVGIPLRIHDTSVGFVTTHLPSDSKGKSKLPKRNGNARSMLRDVVLAADDLGVDVQHTMDHVILVGDLNYRTKTPALPNEEGTLIGEGASALLGIAEASLQDMRAMQYDPFWYFRKYALLHAKKSPLYPDADELKIIENCEAASLKAWDSVLQYDELVDMMQLGEVFYGFREMMPRFPPTYKRKLHDAGECGDYTRYDDLVKGYSHTGEDKEEVNEEALGRATMESSVDIEAMDRPESLSSIRPLSGTDEGRSRSSSDVERPLSESFPKKKAASRRSSVFAFRKKDITATAESSDEIISTPVKKNKRRSSILNSFKSDAQLEAEEEEKRKSKLRPPSYTDRILVHSLRKDKLTIDSYGFCDSIRCSDHRPVSSSMTLTVNSQVLPPNANSGDEEKKSKVTEHAVLLDIKLKDLDVTFKRAGEVVNPLAGGSATGQAPKPLLESFAEEEEEEDKDEIGKSQQLASESGSGDDKVKHRKRRGRGSRLSISVKHTSDIEPFEIAENVQPAEIVIMCPLPTKDPLIEYRKLFDLMNALGEQKGVDVGGLKVSRKRKEQLLRHQNSYSWTDAIQGRIELSSCGDISLGIEALVKLVDTKGEDMGEALIHLTDAVKGEMFDQPFEVEVPISHGGQFRGRLLALVTVSRVNDK